MRVHAAIVIAVVGLACSGCGTGIGREFPNRLISGEGQLIVLEDIEAVVDDPDLSDDEKRSRLEELGIQDVDLLEALLAL